MPRPLHIGYSHYNWLLMEYQYDPVRTACARRPALARLPRFIHTSYALAALYSREHGQPVALHAAGAPPQTLQWNAQPPGLAGRYCWDTPVLCVPLQARFGLAIPFPTGGSTAVPPPPACWSML